MSDIPESLQYTKDHEWAKVGHHQVRRRAAR